MASESASAGAAAVDDASIATLRQLKQAETEWAEKLAKARADNASEIARLKADADNAVEQARAKAEKDRDAKLRDARSRADAEASEIVRIGELEALTVADADPGDDETTRRKVLDAVLGPFRPGAKKGA
ncbi:MAG TPA: hypothetical protein VFF67_08285 [Thermoplasmata archaeon]|nr:hypothetical protein [Thermoplasmata archaeon]